MWWLLINLVVLLLVVRVGAYGRGKGFLSDRSLALTFAGYWAFMDLTIFYLLRHAPWQGKLVFGLIAALHFAGSYLFALWLIRRFEGND
jgi:hypothetical protein